MTEFIANVNMTTIICYKCSILFAVPKDFNDRQLKLKNKGSFYCPNGHPQCYSGKTQEEVLKSQLESVKKCCIELEEATAKKEYQIRNLKGQITKIKKGN